MLTGVLAGTLATGITAIGEWQADLIAGGLAGFPATSAVVVVAPAGATGVATATALLAGALGVASFAVLNKARATATERRLFWGGALVVAAAVLLLGAAASQGTLEPGPHTGLTAVLAAAGHSSLLALLALIAILKLVTPRRRDPERGRLVG